MAKTNWNTMASETMRTLNTYAQYVLKDGIAHARKCEACKDWTRIVERDREACMTETDPVRLQKARDDYKAHSAHLSQINAEYQAEKIIFDQCQAHALAIVTDNLYQAYCVRKESVQQWKEAFRTWAKDMLNVTLTDSTLEIFMVALGDRESKGRKALTQTLGLRNMKQSEFASIVIKNVCVLNPFINFGATAKALKVELK